MFTFTLAFLCRPPIFFSSFSVSFLFSQKEGEGIERKHSQQKPLTTTTTKGQAYSVKLIALLALQHTFHLFPKKMNFKVLKKTYEL